MLTPEQLAAANKAGLDALVELTRKSFEGIEKLVELNLRTMRGTIGDSLSPNAAGRMPAMAETAGAYSRELCEIALGTQKEVQRLVHAQLAAAQQTILVMDDTAVKTTPEASDSTEMVRTAVSAASAAMERVQQAARQAVDRTGAQVDAIVQPPAPPKTPARSEAVGP